MDRIVIEVDDSLARRWRNTPPETKQKVSKEVDIFLNTILARNEDEIWPFLEQLRVKAELRGFNDQVLEQILNEK